MPAGTARRHPARAFTRRRMLATTAATVALPPVLAACAPGGQRQDDATDALLALADAARMDAALAVAAVTADPALAGRLEPLRAARMEHAAALDQAGGRAPGSAPTPASPPAADLAAVRDSVAAAARTAGEVVPQASALQVGLVAEVAACCATYAAVLQ
ncbi:hypothetical protein SAMN05216207_1002228 [Pseudonocardia ammonioxydans]|uniref:DUF4439 domain-containing protein n=1 Tax=Pseudonocardia ammonioxydans TaxID=260086 RepID=A0A1I4TCN9_PSUAM|nr:hypothetical protein [Pseudonocardia ammonioxydans]SFM74489.1 hypothetical protein SAMN05216207_1002228 [Pseudonocardia ammonioxydans]